MGRQTAPASYLDGSASSGQEMRYEQNNGDHEKQVDRPESNVKRDKSEQPQHKQYTGYSS